MNAAPPTTLVFPKKNCWTKKGGKEENPDRIPSQKTRVRKIKWRPRRSRLRIIKHLEGDRTEVGPTGQNVHPSSKEPIEIGRKKWEGPVERGKKKGVQDRGQVFRAHWEDFQV